MAIEKVTVSRIDTATLRLQSAVVDVNSAQFAEVLDLRYRALDAPAGVMERQGYYVEDMSSTAQHVAIEHLPDHKIVAATRMTVLDAEVQLARFAVEPQLQGRHIGQLLLTSCEGLAIAAGAEMVSLWARPSAVGFYEKSGYVTTGPVITENELTYPLMQKLLV